MQESKEKFKQSVIFFCPENWHQLLERSSKELAMSKSEIMRESLFAYLKSKQARERKKALIGK